MTRPCALVMCVGRVGITAGRSGNGIIGRCFGCIVRDAMRIPRTNAGRVRRVRIGRVMTRPYVQRTAPHIPTRVHQPFPYHNDPMHMVGHHNKFPDIHMRHVFRYRIPTLLGQFTDG